MGAGIRAVLVDLPGSRGGFYAEQVETWRGAAEDETARRRWEQVRLPLLGVLGAARAPLTVAELARFAAVPSPEAARAFVEESARAFLSSRDDGPFGRAALCAAPSEPARFVHRPRPSTAGPEETSARMLTAQVQAAHRQITNALIPPGEPGQRDWQVAGPVLAAGTWPRMPLPRGYLDDLASDPGFLLSVDPRCSPGPAREPAHSGWQTRAGSLRSWSTRLGSSYPSRLALTA